MARRTVIQLVDDLDGVDITDRGETVPFQLDETAYEIDLGPGHAAELRAALQPYIAAGRRHPGGRRGGRRRRPRTT